MTIFKINAGKYKHIIMIQNLVETQNEYGETTSEWTDFKKVKAGLYPISAKELLTASSVINEITHKVMLRYVAGINAEQRILFGDRVFNIVAPPIDFQEQHKELQLLCKEVLH